MPAKTIILDNEHTYIIRSGVDAPSPGIRVAVAPLGQIASAKMTPQEMQEKAEAIRAALRYPH